MSSEQPGAAVYCRRSYRKNGVVKKINIGGNQQGQFAVRLIELKKAERREADKAWRRMLDRLAPLDELTDELVELCSVMFRARMLALGFHRPSRHNWVLRRCPKPTKTSKKSPTATKKSPT